MEGISEEVTFKLKPERKKRQNQSCKGPMGKSLRWRAQQVQRPCSWKELDIVE